MDSLHPPFVSGSTTIPRQLNRWLDVNPQGGPLRRTQTFITLPAFSIPVTWSGYSDIVGEYHFESPNNFSLTSLSAEAPVLPNYTLCISYVNSDNTVIRYSLWRSELDVIGQQIQEYTGQLIKKNFRLEMWSTNVSHVAQTLPVLLYTTVLGDLDYRYGTDSTLVNNDGLCEGQESISTVPQLPLTHSPLYAFDYTSGITGVFNMTAWQDQINNFNLVKTTGTALGPSYSINSFVSDDCVLEKSGIGGLTPGPAHTIFFTQLQDTISSGVMLKITLSGSNGNLVIKQSNAIIQIGLDGVLVHNFTRDGSLEIYMIELYSNGAGHSIVSLGSRYGKVYETFDIGATTDIGSITKITLCSSAPSPLPNFSILAFYCYGQVLSPNERSAIISRAFFPGTANLYGQTSMSLPLTWGQCSQPNLNT